MMIDLRSGCSGDDFMLDSDELRSDDEMLVKTKPKPKRKLKRKRQQQKLKPIFKKPETVNNRQFFLSRRILSCEVNLVR